MKIIVTGSLGNVSKPLIKALAQKDHDITVISSNEERKTAIEALGAKAAIGSVRDVNFLETAFAGSDVAYLMVPPNYTEPDQVAYYRMVGTNYAQAIRKTGVKRVVHLSSWGAHLSAGTGPILGSHNMEKILNALPGITLTHPRATSFFTNLYTFIPMIKEAGIIGTNYGGEDRLAMVHPTDIAAAVVEEIEKPATVKRPLPANEINAPGASASDTAQTTGTSTANIRYVSGDEHTASEVAHILGAAIGKPALQWLTFTNEQTREALEKRGVPAALAAGLVDLGNAMHTGKLREDYDKHKPAVMGKIKTEDFAREFATRF